MIWYVTTDKWTYDFETFLSKNGKSQYLRQKRGILNGHEVTWQEA